MWFRCVYAQVAHAYINGSVSSCCKICVESWKDVRGRATLTVTKVTPHAWKLIKRADSSWKTSEAAETCQNRSYKAQIVSWGSLYRFLWFDVSFVLLRLLLLTSHSPPAHLPRAAPLQQARNLPPPHRKIANLRARIARLVARKQPPTWGFPDRPDPNTIGSSHAFQRSSRTLTSCQVKCHIECHFFGQFKKIMSATSPAKAIWSSSKNIARSNPECRKKWQSIYQIACVYIYIYI